MPLTLLPMDTISRESSSSYLPVAGVLVGVLALIIAAFALIRSNSVGKQVTTLSDSLAGIESKANDATAAAEKANANIAKLQTSVQSAFDSIGPEIGGIKASIQKLEDAAKAHAVAPKGPKGTSAEPAVAGPDEYVVKPGDTGTKISKATGVSVANLEAANPGINWHKLRVGQKIKTK